MAHYVLDSSCVPDIRQYQCNRVVFSDMLGDRQPAHERSSVGLNGVYEPVTTLFRQRSKVGPGVRDTSSHQPNGFSEHFRSPLSVACASRDEAHPAGSMKESARLEMTLWLGSRQRYGFGVHNRLQPGIDS